MNKFLIFLFLIYYQSFAQNKLNCDSIFENPDTLAYLSTFDKSANYSDMILLNSNFNYIRENQIASIRIHFTIDSIGNVISLEFKRGFFYNTDEIAEKLTSMKWNPAIKNGKNVCSKYIWFKGCIKYQ